MDVITIAAAPRSTNIFDSAECQAGPFHITFEIAEPEALLRFLDAAQPSAERQIPRDVVTIADAIEARLAMSVGVPVG